MSSSTDPSLRLPDGLASAAAVYRRAFLEGLRPDPELTVSEWADEHRVLSREASAEHGQWRTERTPYLREIMDVLSASHPETDVTVVKGTQLGGSEAGYNWLGAIIDLWPAPTMLVLPTKDAAKLISTTRVAPMIAACPTVRDKVADTKSRVATNTTMRKEFRGGVLRFAGANSGTDLRSMPVRFLFLDEIDGYPLDVDGEGDPVELALARTDTFPRRKVFRCSSPTRRDTSRVWPAYEAGDQRQYMVPCPHCAHEQALRWEQMRWTTRHVHELTDRDSGEIRVVEPDTPGAVERDTDELQRVWYECESCSGEIDEDRHKTAMLTAGRWVPQRIDGGRHRSYHLPALYSPIGWLSWRTAVAKRLKADQDPTGALLQVWTNTVLGLPYGGGGDSVEKSVLEARIDRGWRLGDPIPQGALLLTCGVDVHPDRLECRVWGWGRAEESWLAHREVIYGAVSDDSTWAALLQLLTRGWTHASGASLRIRATCIDAGDGNTTHYVRAFARAHAHRHVLATKGQAVAGKPILGRPTLQDVTHRGRPIKGGVRMWPLGSDTAKAVLYARYAIDTPGPQYMHLPSGLPDDELDQMTAESCQVKYVHGHPRRVWTKPAAARNEALDCYVMALAAAHYAGVTRAHWDDIEAQLAQPGLFDRAVPAAATAEDTAAPDTSAAPERDEAAARPAASSDRPGEASDNPPPAAAPAPTVARTTVGQRPAPQRRIAFPRRPSGGW